MRQRRIHDCGERKVCDKRLSNPARGITARALVATSVVVGGWLAAADVRGQAITDSQLLGVTSRGTVTQKFEIYNPHSADELRAIKAMGFTQVILDWPNLHADATELGLNVVLANWWTEKTPQADIERSLTLAKQVDRRRLVGISIMDEPQRNAPDTPLDYYVKTYRQLRPRLDRDLPDVALEISHWGPLASWDRLDYHLFSDLYRAADVMRIMPYPDLHEGPLNDVYLMMQRSRGLMKQVQRELPLLVILQAWTLPPKSELPTIDELRVMAYQVVLGGAETLSFYHYRPAEWAGTPGFAEQFAQLMQELTELSRQFADASVASRLEENGIFHAVLTMPRGEVVEFRVNTRRRAVDDLAPLAIQRRGKLPAALDQRDFGPAAARASAIPRRWRARKCHPWRFPARRSR